MSDSKFNWEEFFKTMGEDHFSIMSYGGDYTIQVEKLYQMFKGRLLSETNLGNAVKKEKS